MAKREKNIELLRIFSMFLIVVGHYIYWGMKNLSSNGSFDITQLSGGGVHTLQWNLYGYYLV